MAWRNLTDDVAELFGELQPDVEGALYRERQNRLSKAREARKLNHAQRRAEHRRNKHYARLLTEMLKAWRVARRPLLQIPPVGRPPELEARAREISRHTRRWLRRRKIAELARRRLVDGARAAMKP